MSEPSRTDRIAEAKAADAAEAADLVAQIIHELENRGVPSGAWLIDIARVRQSLREADTLLRRLEDTIIRVSSASPLDEL
jgi:hypothetical protein